MQHVMSAENLLTYQLPVKMDLIAYLELMPVSNARTL